jgi:hypothetical protein
MNVRAIKEIGHFVIFYSPDERELDQSVNRVEN